MPDFRDSIEQNLDGFLSELGEWLRIASVSTDGAHQDEVQQAAEWLRDKLRAAGLEHAELIPTAGNPMVFAEHVVDPSAPTLLIYGHYDVQPEDPVDLWTSPAFEPTVRDGRLYARGTVDDKGQIHMHVKAIETRMRTGAGVPVNLKFLIEGEEEIGSEHLAGFLEENRDKLSCDAVLISDTGMLGADLPAITVALRGIVYMEVHVRGPAKDLHSGSYGGAVVNPCIALAGMLAALKDADGRVTIPGFYDLVREITDRDRADLDAVPWDDEVFRAEAGSPTLGGETGFSTLERLWFRPALDVNGVWGGFTGDGSKTVLPSRAAAKVSMRLVSDQDPVEIAKSFERHVLNLAPEGVEVEVRHLHGGHPWVADTSSPIFEAADDALERAFGRKPVYMREGGSIPIIPLFEQMLEAPAVLIGFSLPGANLHAPDEWLDLSVYQNGIGALADLYDGIAERGV
jgi:acetylornithine deacetylase/succinyl-diaminopimelate desuccinylase-like protein